MRSVLKSYTRESQRHTHHHRAPVRRRTPCAKVAEHHVVAVRAGDALRRVNDSAAAIRLGHGEVETLRQVELGQRRVLDGIAQMEVPRPRLPRDRREGRRGGAGVTGRWLAVELWCGGR